MRTMSFQLMMGRASANCRRFIPVIESRVLSGFIFSLTVVVSLANLPVAEAALPEFDRVRILTKPPQISNGELTDYNGQSFQLSSLQGRVALIFFGFTNCPDVCPMGMEKMRRLAESGQIDAGEVAYIMISVDGERDTPEVMKAYVQGFSKQFVGLTGAPAQVKRIAKSFSAAFFKEGGAEQGGAYSVSHSPQIFVVDQGGRLRAEFYNASIEAMAGVTQALLQEEPVVSTGQGNEK